MKGNMKKHTGKIWRGLATTTASLLTITLGGSSIANARVDFINATLGTSSYKIEQEIGRDTSELQSP